MMNTFLEFELTNNKRVAINAFDIMAIQEVQRDSHKICTIYLSGNTDDFNVRGGYDVILKQYNAIASGVKE
jgi:hypothetical protein